MEEERMKMFGHPNVVLVAKGNRPNVKRVVAADKL